jgi:hypothetical protein
MDDFLHNLRSGKLKQVDRSNRPYNDQQFKGGQRRNLDRRNKPHFENKDSANAIKEVLESLVDSQKQMTEAYQARTRAEERKARAMEVIAKNLYRMLNPNATDAEEILAISEPERSQAPPGRIFRERSEMPNRAAQQSDTFSDEDQEADTVETRPDNDKAASVESAEQSVYPDESEEVDAAEELKPAGEDLTASSGKLTEDDRRKLFKLIDRMRAEGQGWEKIARNLTSQGHPTISGKGTWRGIMVKNLHEKMALS